MHKELTIKADAGAHIKTIKLGRDDDNIINTLSGNLKLSYTCVCCTRPAR